MAGRLQGKSALVTGATSNIGRAIAVEFAREGAEVVVHGRDAERAASVLEAIESFGGVAHVVIADLDGSAVASRGLASESERVLGRPVDVLVNNAGIYPHRATADVDEELFDQVYDVNVKAPFFLTGAIAPAMAERGGGVIVNLGSWIARLGVPSPLYSSTKGAMETLTRAWSAEYGPSGVRVNAISPGVVQPPGGLGAAMMLGTPAGDVGQPEAIAHAAVYLASDDAAFVHGTVIDVDGRGGGRRLAALAGKCRRQFHS